MSVLGLKPMVAHLMEIVVVMMKSGIARCDGKRMTSPYYLLCRSRGYGHQRSTSTH
jgi:hypothetical protein